MQNFHNKQLISYKLKIIHHSKAPLVEYILKAGK